MKLYLFSIFLFIYLFNKTKLEINVQYGSITVDEFTDLLSSRELNETQSKSLISSIKNVLSDFYIYINMTNSSKVNNNPVDLINKLNSINPSDIQNILDFVNTVQNILSLSKDFHLSLNFILFAYFNYLIPIEFKVGTKDAENYLYYTVSKNDQIRSLFNEESINIFLKK